ncbi:RNA polymerase sigma factor [Staphylococcus caprae]|uniref:RNA polymerase sigma factor n=1 Tax=Staphylococcus caprae TaxID=29380 RepID=UPI0015594ED7|nr:RNA polymerase sigma factor [Staphylococcus caprae]MBN6827040.1 RNA polymerase sigma factor [Staphylococcus caprae]MBX5317253.1 RNA polymerase sigma factor [Staphylococcus caprae]
MSLNNKHHEQTSKCYFTDANEDIDQLFITLLEELRPFIFRKIGYLTSNQFDIEDMYQDILIKMYLALQNFDFSRSIPFKRYLYFLIRSVKYDYLRKLKAERHREPLLINECVVDYNCALAIDEVERSFFRKELSKEFNKQVFTLSRMEKEIIHLVRREYKPREIAHILRLRDKDVYNAIQRCKIKMKRQLKK